MDVTEPVSQVIGNESGENGYASFSMAMLWRPDWPATGRWLERLPLVFWLVEAIRPRTVLVVGADARDAFLGACEAIERLELPARVLSGLNPAQPYDDEAAGIHASRWSSFSRVLPGGPVAALRAIEPNSVDLAIVGADIVRSADPLAAGLLRSCLSECGILLLERPAEMADAAPFADLLIQSPSLDFYHAGGVRIVAPGPFPKGKLAALLAPREKNERAVAIARALLARLGEGLRASLRAELGWAAAERLEATLAEAAGRAEATAAEAGEIARVRALWDQERAAFEAEGKTHADEIARLRALCDQERAAFEAEGKTHADEIARLRTLCDQERAAFEAEGKTHADEIARLRALCDQERAAFEAKEVKFGASQAEARAAYAMAQSALARLRERSEDTDRQLKAVQAEMPAARAELAHALASYEQARRDADGARAELASVHGSTSWRMTWPLRRMASRYPKAARWSRRAIRLAWWSATLQLSSRYREWRHWRAALLVLHQENNVAEVTGPAEPHAMQPAAAVLPAAELQARAWESRAAQLEHRVLVVESWASAERERVDWALGAIEGVAAQIDEYHAERETPGYQAAFEDSDPLVSICVATVNRSDQLIECAIASLQAQTHRNLQIVVVGDHCTDDTAQRLARLRDGRIVFVNLHERGPYPPPGMDRWRVAGTNAMNHALSLCEGSFVTHLDDDDRMTTDKIETMLAAARMSRSDFLWHAFWYEGNDGTWSRLGRDGLDLGQVTTGSIFYHRWFTRVPWDVRAYRLGEPGDWNRLRKIKMLRPRLRYVDLPLMYHHAEQSQPNFVRQDGERYLG